ncbi:MULTISPECIES: GNAT family N-acetyltransferase [Providencia]|uniref:GNAT family N-acetyltransferase n=1 Tax=Providencia TaxID=586 RepID=UPI000E3EAE11|nr:MULTISPECIES: GNAT family N-acetyltransferase [Providencia]ELH9583011.1 GNAT family N-acetyltransferase [Providencia rettgeri]ELM3936623.1 GNAT family N-acetyltransferase [Providencia rettgeri]ELR5287732.1 GNAT family N-acetyltransferase [Providencia rettgeri]ELR5295057.1 GNAT family N-acetyltransferase [Providencia rettgeri]EMA4644732.1 GNAT family N-acetyltransferase [Providencia rettgeri]
MKTNFRAATLIDINAIFSIDTIATTERYEDITQWLEQEICYVLEANNEILAYGVLHYYFYSHAFIELLMVNKNHRRQGLGLTLINKLKMQSKTPKIFTSTNQSNTATQQLLIKTGFIPSGYIENLDDNDPELIYCYISD